MADVGKVGDAVARLSPAAYVTFLDITNYLVSTSLKVLTTVYILFQIVVIFPKVLNVFKRRKNES